MNNRLYPLKFSEVIQNYDFGNRKIPELFPDKDLPEDKIIAETWEVSAHPDFPGTVVNGPLKGKTLPEVTSEYGEELLGKEIEEKFGRMFPLLLKFLDARQTLEVQIHPNDDYAKTHNLDQMGKPECWYILEADPGAFLYWNTKEGVTYEDLQSIGPNERKFRDYLMKVEVTRGDVLHLPPGRIHAIGGGIVLFELQQTSDVTLGPDYLFSSGGKVEGFDSEKAFDMFLDQLDLEEIPEGDAIIPPVSLKKGGNVVTYLLASKYFAMEKLELNTPFTHKNGGVDRFVTLTSTEGTVKLETDFSDVQLPQGRTALIPASTSEFLIKPEGEWAELLKCYIPDLVRDIINPLLSKDVEKGRIAALGGPGSKNDLRPILNRIEEEAKK
ncbi:hypothetical protein KGY64_03650 [Candidatus Bipolaricaulota bacterium]|nr:hypothetical protein [Candidatus Bipolaricaulota bacterium]